MNSGPSEAPFDTPADVPTEAPPPLAAMRRVFSCRCGRPIFFRNSRCLNCDTALGYEPETAMLLPMEDAGDAAWHIVGPDAAGYEGTLYRRCANHELAARCNWLVVADPTGNALCRCCRLNRVVPDQAIDSNRALWHRVEIAKRRLVSSLIALKLPVASRLSEDTARGMAFDLLVGAAAGAVVMTGHSDGIITLNVDEADDATREAVRSAMHEPYRTVLGHLRHESGHYYWGRLVDGSAWHEPFRALFGDERQDYGAALAQHHAEGPRAGWQANHVSAYASSHPWEDWAETWAHYLHMLDALDTAASAGIDRARVELLQDPFLEDVLYRAPSHAPTIESAEADRSFLAFVNAWVELTSVVNELSRSMGQVDFYPFVLNGPTVAKLHFIHLLVNERRVEDRAVVNAVAPVLAPPSSRA